MARKRMVDPEFWLDEDITSVGFADRLFYIGTWNFADDYGVIEYAPKKLKAQVFPYDEIDCAVIIKKFIDLGKYVQFEAEGKQWLYIKKFLKYQRIDKPSATRNPEPPVNIVDEDYPSTLGVFDAEEKRREESIREEKISKSQKYLLNIPTEDLKEFCSKFMVTPTQVKSKAEDLNNYCQAKGKRYSNYKAFLQTALKKDFRPRVKETPPEPIKEDSPETKKKKDEISKMLADKFTVK